MERVRNISGLLSIAVMSVLAMVLFSMVDQPKDDQRESQPVTTDTQPAKPPGTMAVAAVILPPPPAPSVKPKHQSETKGARLKPLPASPSRIIPVADATDVVSDNSTTESDGRTLLRLLEFGKGPSIKIAWPAEKEARDRLYQIFINCFGMKTLLIDTRERLLLNDGVSGEAWRPNLDQFSSFMRQPSGVLSNAEIRKITAIRKHHRLTGGTPVRLFPRRIDAILLGGLKKIVGDTYQAGSDITATYRLNGNRVSVDHIRINGHENSGKIILPAARKCIR